MLLIYSIILIIIHTFILQRREEMRIPYLRFPQVSNRGYIDPICTLTNFFGSIGSVFGGKFFGAVTDRHFASLGGVITRLSLETSLHGQIWPFPPSQLSPLLFGSRRSYWLLRESGSATHSIRSMRCALRSQNSAFGPPPADFGKEQPKRHDGTMATARGL